MSIWAWFAACESGIREMRVTGHGVNGNGNTEEDIADMSSF